MRYGDLPYEEIRERASHDWLAVVPTGYTEQQGPRVPVDFDTWFVEKVTLAASDRAASRFKTYSLVLPTIPFGSPPEHRNFCTGHIEIPKNLHESLIYAVLSSLAEQGFRRIIV
jgi:creatinine amidohydrolase